MKIIVGLGNTGARYERTRHNVGFLVIDRLAAQQGIAVDRSLCSCLIGEGILENRDVVLAKPQTFMNRSGSAVACLLRERAISADDLAVVNDDLDLPFGRIRIRPSGSAGGHRGLISISEELAGTPFLRIRVGIGRPPEGCSVIDYVLEGFSAVENEKLDEIIDRAAAAIACLLREGMGAAMTSYNGA